MRNGEEGDAIVSVRDVHKVYELGEPVPVLNGVSLDLQRGSYTAIMGPSGSGKSTLLNLVGCLDRPTTGTVHVDGVDVTTLDDAKRTTVRRDKVGFVFQQFNLMPKLTAIQNVALPLVFKGVPRAQRRERARELLERMDMSDRGDHHPNELSGGQRQRVAIARSLANDPALLLADEPTGSLDSETGARIMGVFEELHEAGNTIVLVTHERPIAEHAERIVHLLDGELERIEELADASPDEDGGGTEADYRWTS
ncbi:ABC transporter ATP-binding protein [Halorarum halophilum]|uniref:ABC transporter ATP-binding protein n=1 Tax=Halorarum halophilum TaxID=2743090 RepID=UPI001FE6B654|nr:ABC transporter ATP-binding protein [Halobaculum halophilum]